MSAASAQAVKVTDAARDEARALAERAGIDMLDDHDEFVTDLAETLIRFVAIGAGGQAVAEEWRDDPSADERWNAGLDYGQTQLCAVIGVDPDAIDWDAATETLDGDVQAVIGKILTARFGDDWPSNLSQPLPADERVVEALREALAREWTNFCDANPDDLTSPEDLPDHALMTCEQFVEYAMFAFSTQEAKP